MRRFAAVMLLLVIALAAGFVFWKFYQPTYQVHGTITRDGKPLAWKSDKGVLDVKFIPLDRQRDPNVYKAETDSTAGTYRITGIPAASYRVSIQQMDPFPTHDLLGFALSIAESPILRDVTMDNEVLDIDIPKVLSKRKQ